MLLEGRTGLIVGLSDRHGFAWSIAQALAGAGAALVLSHEPRHARRAPELAAALPTSATTVQLDVSDDAGITAAFEQIGAEHGGLDFLVHAVAFAPPQALLGRFVDTEREAFRIALDISTYSLIALARAAEPLFAQRGGGSIVTLTYYGAEKAVLGYKVMGVAKAALEATGALSGCRARAGQRPRQRGLPRTTPHDLRPRYPRLHGYVPSVPGAGAAAPAH